MPREMKVKRRRRAAKEKWKECVNYTIRNIDVMDEEETRIPEDKPHLMKCFKKEGVSGKDLAKLDDLIVEGQYDLNYEDMRDILKPYMSHKKLYEADVDRWHFQTWNDPEDWKGYEAYADE